MKVIWETKLEAIIQRLRRILFMDLKLHTIIFGVNTYIFSTIYFLDQHDPIPPPLLRDFINKVKQQIIKFIYPPIHVKDQLWYIPRQQGGLGLIDLEKQLLGRRAYYMLLALNPSTSSAQHPYIAPLLRLELQLHAQQRVFRQYQFDTALTTIDEQVQQHHNVYSGTDPIYVDNIFTSTTSITTLPWFSILVILSSAPSLLASQWFYEAKFTSPTTLDVNYSQRYRNLHRDEMRARMLDRDRYYLDRNIVPPPMGNVPAPPDLTLPYDQHVTIKYHRFSGEYINIAPYLNAWKHLIEHKIGTYQPITFTNNNINYLIHAPQRLPGFGFIRSIKINESYRSNLQPSDAEEAFAITAEELNHSSKHFHDNKNYIHITSRTWELLVDKTEVQWKTFYKKLSKYLVLHPNTSSFYYGLHAGLFNNTFYRPCQLCGQESVRFSPIKHTFLECRTSQQIFHYLLCKFQQKHPDVRDVNFYHLLCTTPFDDTFIPLFNEFIGFIIYCTRSNYARRVNHEVAYTFNLEEIQQIFTLFQQRA